MNGKVINLVLISIIKLPYYLYVFNFNVSPMKYTGSVTILVAYYYFYKRVAQNEIYSDSFWNAYNSIVLSLFMTCIRIIAIWRKQRVHHSTVRCIKSVFALPALCIITWLGRAGGGWHYSVAVACCVIARCGLAGGRAGWLMPARSVEPARWGARIDAESANGVVSGGHPPTPPRQRATLPATRPARRPYWADWWRGTAPSAGRRFIVRMLYYHRHRFYCTFILSGTNNNNYIWSLSAYVVNALHTEVDISFQRFKSKMRSVFFIPLRTWNFFPHSINTSYCMMWFLFVLITEILCSSKGK